MIRRGSLQPRASGRWQRVNVLELGSAASRVIGEVTSLIELGRVRCELLTGSPEISIQQPAASADRYVLLLAGGSRCNFERDGAALGYLIARVGELFLCPCGVGTIPRSTPQARPRWIAAVLRPT